MDPEKVIAGIDIGGTTVKCGLFTEEGEKKCSWEIPTRKGENGALMFSDIAESLSEHLREEGALLGIGMGVPGAVEPDGHLERCVNIGLSDVYPAEEMKKSFPQAQVRVLNDANAAALGEMWLGSARGRENVVMITLGTGVGGGVICGGRLLTGAKGMAGEIGHMVVDPFETRPCNCGACGCLEQYASATGIVRVMKDVLEKRHLPSLLRAEDDFTAKDVFDAAKAGDAAAMEAVGFAADKLAYAMHLISQTVDPEIFLLGGGVSRAGEYLRSLTEKRYRSRMKLQSRVAEVALASLGNDAGMAGAAYLALTDGAERR